MKEQSFFHDALQTNRQDWIRFDQHKKKSTCKALIVTFKKTQEFLTFFSRLYLYFPHFFQVRKIVGQNNFRTFSRIQDSVQTLITETANAEYPRSQTHKGTLLLALQTQDTYSDLELLPLPCNFTYISKKDMNVNNSLCVLGIIYAGCLNGVINKLTECLVASCK